MSLVERALKKLQEAKGAEPQARLPEPDVSPRASVPNVSETATRQQRVDEIDRSGVVDCLESPKRIVPIDRDALRAMELLPPAGAERQIASQYQHIKRPLVTSAFGRSGSAIANGHLIMLASALPGEGKTFTSLNLALSMALEKDSEVLLVDADVPKPHITRIFGLQAERGLLDLLVDSTLRLESVILPTNIAGLSILPVGRQVDNATELLSSQRMEQVVQQLGGGGGRRIVLFDSPPLLLATESRAIVSVVGQVVLVVRAETTAQKAVMDAIDMVGDAKPISLILNQSEVAPSGGYYGYGSYGYSASEAAAQRLADSGNAD